MGLSLIDAARARYAPGRVFTLWKARELAAGSERLAALVATRWEKAADFLRSHLEALREPASSPRGASERAARRRRGRSDAAQIVPAGRRELGVAAEKAVPEGSRIPRAVKVLSPASANERVKTPAGQPTARRALRRAGGSQPAESATFSRRAKAEDAASASRRRARGGSVSRGKPLDPRRVRGELPGAAHPPAGRRGEASAGTNLSPSERGGDRLEEPSFTASRKLPRFALSQGRSSRRTLEHEQERGGDRARLGSREEPGAETFLLSSRADARDTVASPEAARRNRALAGLLAADGDDALARAVMESLAEEASLRSALSEWKATQF